MALMTRTEVAKFFGISPRTLDRWARDGIELPFVRINGTIRYRDKDLEEFMDRMTVRPQKDNDCQLKVA